MPKPAASRGPKIVPPAFSAAGATASGAIFAQALGDAFIASAKLSTGKAETIRMLLAEAGVPFEESNFEKPDGVQIYAMGGEGMKAARTSPAAVEFFEACRSGDRCPPCSLLGVW